MKKIVCSNCGSSDFYEKEGKKICCYCGTVYYNESTSNIDINDDIQRLLDLCKKDPANKVKYANLILDIDATNEEALEILRK